MKIFSEHSLDEAATLLKAGELVAFPTETVYGLGASLFNPEAIAKIFKVKGRPTDNPLIVHLSNPLAVSQIAVDIPDRFYRLANAFFPGPLTVILKKHPSVSSLAAAGLSTIAFRCPKHLLAQKLIELVGQPLVAPSANLSGRPSATSAAHVLQDFQGKIAAVVDGGDTPLGMESTVVSLVSSSPMLLRPGEISLEQIEAILGEKVFLASKSEPISSPGMKYRHYAPKAPLKLITSHEELEKHLNPSVKQMVLAKTGTPFFLSRKSLYAMLRLADEQEYQEILVFCDAETLQDPVLMNRLIKATSF